jgi:hypothetical protein
MPSVYEVNCTTPDRRLPIMSTGSEGLVKALLYLVYVDPQDDELIDIIASQNFTLPTPADIRPIREFYRPKVYNVKK